ncbi:hypothetical protein RM844_11860 [Streptomyces sp. DSM 44915]|uniref:Uncharacterized protein n=1 Tax=Streptomyces chisholmiae TaxID=3075540 RepID=A0ABU2JPS9_9ACTN|nr:hypothetical protein [Streptomyces sp. DSM 44915]MDT0266984.1 hypothetical protein [Streptomyces sp. DSM 44915]
MREDGTKAIAEILDELGTTSNVQVRSSHELAAEVTKAAADEDKKRVEDGRGPLRRRTDYGAVRRAPRSLSLTPWQVLHAIGLGAAAARQGAGRGLAEHWGSLRYSQALEANRGQFLRLSSEGRDLLRFYKATQSGEIGTGFASLLAEHIVRSRYPDHSVSVIPADIALKAGWTLRSSGTGARPEPLQRRPHFFVEAWQPGQPSKVFLMTSKGTHSSVHQVYKQLSTASAHVESVHIGPYGTVPYLLIGTEIPAKESLALHVLEAPGTTLLRPPGDTQGVDLDVELPQENLMSDVVLPTEGDRTVIPGFQVLPGSFGWFSVVLARTEAAALTAFTGGGTPTAQYLTKEQGRRHFQHDAQASKAGMRDAEHRIHDIDFVGTDHIYRLNGTRVEAFSGLERSLYTHLHQGHVNEYRRETHGRRGQWPSRSTAKYWNTVSIRADGTVLAIRLRDE